MIADAKALRRKLLPRIIAVALLFPVAPVVLGAAALCRSSSDSPEALAPTSAQLAYCRRAFDELDPLMQEHIRRVDPGSLDTAICMTCSCAVHPEGMPATEVGGETVDWAAVIREIPWTGGKMIVCAGGLMPPVH